MIDPKDWKNLEARIIGFDPKQPHAEFEQAMREFLNGLPEENLRTTLSKIEGFNDSSYCKSPTEISWEMAEQSRPIGGSMSATMEDFCDRDMTSSARAEAEETQADKSQRIFRIWAGQTAKRIATKLLELSELRLTIGKTVEVEHYCDTIANFADDQPSAHNVNVYIVRGILEKVDDQSITVAGQTIVFRDEDNPMKSGSGVPVGCGYVSSESAITLILADGKVVYDCYDLLPEAASHQLTRPQ